MQTNSRVCNTHWKSSLWHSNKVDICNVIASKSLVSSFKWYLLGFKSSSSHTQIGILSGFNLNFPMSIPDLFISEFLPPQPGVLDFLTQWYLGSNLSEGCTPVFIRKAKLPKMKLSCNWLQCILLIFNLVFKTVVLHNLSHSFTDWARSCIYEMEKFYRWWNLPSFNHSKGTTIANHATFTLCILDCPYSSCQIFPIYRSSAGNFNYFTIAVTLIKIAMLK